MCVWESVTLLRVYDGIDSLLPAWRLLRITARLTSLRTASHRDVITEVKVKPQNETVKSTATSDSYSERDFTRARSIDADLLHMLRYIVETHVERLTDRHTNTQTWKSKRQLGNSGVCWKWPLKWHIWTKLQIFSLSFLGGGSGGGEKEYNISDCHYQCNQCYHCQLMFNNKYFQRECLINFIFDVDNCISLWRCVLAVPASAAPWWDGFTILKYWKTDRWRNMTPMLYPCHRECIQYSSFIAVTITGHYYS